MDKIPPTQKQIHIKSKQQNKQLWNEAPDSIIMETSSTRERVFVEIH